MGIVKCITCGKSDCNGDSHSEGGLVKVKFSKHHDKNEHLYAKDEGTSKQGHRVRSANLDKSWAKDDRSSSPSTNRAVAKDKMSEARGIAGDRLESERKVNPNIHGLAEGGEVDEALDVDMDQDLDNELMEMAAEELVSALEKKDKKGIVEAIKALVMSCKE